MAATAAICEGAISFCFVGVELASTVFCFTDKTGMNFFSTTGNETDLGAAIAELVAFVLVDISIV